MDFLEWEEWEEWEEWVVVISQLRIVNCMKFSV